MTDCTYADDSGFFRKPSTPQEALCAAKDVATIMGGTFHSFVLQLNDTPDASEIMFRLEKTQAARFISTLVHGWHATLTTLYASKPSSPR